MLLDANVAWYATGSAAAPQQRAQPLQFPGVGSTARPHSNSSQNVPNFTAAKPAATNSFPASDPVAATADRRACAAERGIQEKSREGAAGESIPAWPSFVSAGCSSPQVKSGSGGAAAAAGSTFGLIFHPGSNEQDAPTGSGRAPRSSRTRKPKYHAARCVHALVCV